MERTSNGGGNADSYTPLLRNRNTQPEEAGKIACMNDSGKVAAPKTSWSLSYFLCRYASTFHVKHLEMSGWRKELLAFMHSPMIQDAVILLLLLDIFCVATEMVLEILETDGIFVYKMMPLLEPALHWTSVSILVIFALEIFLYVVAKGTSFFLEFLEVLDLVIVAGSLYQDLTFKHAEGRLLVMFRVWRFGRIFHGVWSAEHEASESKIRKLEEKIEALEAQLRQQDRKDEGVVNGK